MRRRLLIPLVALSLSACDGGSAPADAPAEAQKSEGKPAETAKSTPTKLVAKPEGNSEVKSEGPTPTPLPPDAHPAWTDPGQATEQAPAKFTCQFDTTKGSFDIEVTREWAPMGADRFYNLCKVGYWNGARFFRNIKGFMVQFGMSAYPDATKAWKEATIKDDPVTQTNAPLMVTFAKTGRPDSRSTQVFINHGDNKNLDSMGFAPFGKVVAGADIVSQLYDGYGEGAPRGRGPRQDLLGEFGEAYLADRFDKLDKIEKTTVK
jgi:peptidyl-prolyl cis-trans isomerase A (cyclophilin A)